MIAICLYIWQLFFYQLLPGTITFGTSTFHMLTSTEQLPSLFLGHYPFLVTAKARTHRPILDGALSRPIIASMKLLV